MKHKWEQICKQLEKFDLALNDFFENGGLSSISITKSKNFLKELNCYEKMVADFDTYMSPVEPLDFDFPFTSDEMIDMWKRWKEYLVEQHGQLMRTRSEKSALEHLWDLSKGDEDKAKSFLRYAMANRYKNFFEMEEKDTKKPGREEAGSGSSFG